MGLFLLRTFGFAAGAVATWYVFHSQVFSLVHDGHAKDMSSLQSMVVQLEAADQRVI